MMQFRDECEPVKRGFNIYPASSSHIGFVLRIGNWVRQVRYSKVVHRLFVGQFGAY